MLFAALGILVLPMSVTADEPNPTVLVNTCYSCHGTDGKSPGAMPSLDGKAPSYIAQTMRDFRSGELESTVMGRIAKGFTDDEIDALADQFGSK